MIRFLSKLCGFILFLGVLLLICFIIFRLPNILLEPNKLGVITTETGPIGDTLGGLTAPFIGGIGVILTFIAFYVQFVANRQQERDLKVERFESKFFELIRIHRENVAEMGNINAGEKCNPRKFFEDMFYEFKYCYYFVYKESKSEKKHYTGLEILNIAFIIFYIGINDNSKQLILELVGNSNKHFIDNLLSKLKEVQFNSKKIIGKTMKHPNGLPPYWELKHDKIKKMNEISYTFSYEPLCGHIDSLGHYLRHIWTTVNFVENSKIVSNKNKYNYIKMFRAQLSSYEQALLHYNALTTLGNSWEILKIENNKYKIAKFKKNKTNKIIGINGLLRDYKLTKNIPYPLINFGPDKYAIYGEEYFEWSEVLKNKIN